MCQKWKEKRSNVLTLIWERWSSDNLNIGLKHKSHNGFYEHKKLQPEK